MREYDPRIPDPERVQPDPMLTPQAAGSARIGITLLGTAFIVVLVLYGLSRQPETQTASAPPAAAPAETTGSGGTQSGASSSTPGAPASGQAAPSAAGQGKGQAQGQAQGQGKGQADGKGQPQSKGQAQNQASQPEPARPEQGRSPRADSATTGRSSAPSDQPAKQ